MRRRRFFFIAVATPGDYYDCGFDVIKDDFDDNEHNCDGIDNFDILFNGKDANDNVDKNNPAGKIVMMNDGIDSNKEDNGGIHIDNLACIYKDSMRLHHTFMLRMHWLVKEQ